MVLIDVDMPESCLYRGDNFKHCFFANTGKCEAYVNYKGDWDGLFNGRLNGCPLKSIDGAIEKLEEARYWGKETKLMENPLSKGLERAIQIVKEYCGVDK